MSGSAQYRVDSWSGGFLGKPYFMKLIKHGFIGPGLVCCRALIVDGEAHNVLSRTQFDSLVIAEQSLCAYIALSLDCRSKCFISCDQHFLTVLSLQVLLMFSRYILYISQ